MGCYLKTHVDISHLFPCLLSTLFYISLLLAFFFFFFPTLGMLLGVPINSDRWSVYGLWETEPKSISGMSNVVSFSCGHREACLWASNLRENRFTEIFFFLKRTTKPHFFQIPATLTLSFFPWRVVLCYSRGRPKEIFVIHSDYSFNSQ